MLTSWIRNPGSLQGYADRERKPHFGTYEHRNDPNLAKITVEKLDNDLTMLGDKLSKSFGNIKVAGI